MVLLAAVLRGQLGDRAGTLAQVLAQRGVDGHRQGLDVAVQDGAGVEGRAAVARLDGRGDLVRLTAQRVRLIAESRPEPPPQATTNEAANPSPPARMARGA